MKIRLVEAALCHTEDGRKDMTKQTVAFRNSETVRNKQ
jgi:hypothetical protein